MQVQGNSQPGRYIQIKLQEKYKSCPNSQADLLSSQFYTLHLQIV